MQHHPKIERIPSQRDHSMKRKSKIKNSNDACTVDRHFTTEEDERTAMAKADKTEVRQKTIDKAHDQSNEKPTASITQQARNTTYGI